MFEYIHVYCFIEDLESRINNLAEDNWRLHTVETTTTVLNGSSYIYASAVMERIKPDQERKDGVINAMGMRG